MRGLSVSNTVLLIICLMYLILFVEIGAAQEPELRQRKTQNTDFDCDFVLSHGRRERNFWMRR
jgi:hypothetical protein